jgi:hypothetical protein
MKNTIKTTMNAILMTLILALSIGMISQPFTASASGGSGGGGGSSSADTIKVIKGYFDAPTGQILIKASSSDTSARLYAYLPSGAYLGEVQNGGGSRYGGSIIVPTTPFQP